MATNYQVTTQVNGSFEIAASAIDTTQTSLNLIGRGASGYGQAVAENTINQLQNFASPNAPSNPLKGQLWYNSSTSILQVYTGNPTTPWDSVGNTAAAQVFVSKSDFYDGTGASLYLLKTEAETTYVKKSDLGGSGSTTVVSAANGGTGLILGNNRALNFLRVKSDSSGFEFVTAAEIANAASGSVLTGADSQPTVDMSWTIGLPAARFKAIWAGTFNGTATSAQYADLAERYKTAEELQPGDVVELVDDDGEGEVRKTTHIRTTSVFGVVSTAPALMMNSDAGDDATAPYIAMAGRVPTKVVGPVKKGDRLVASQYPGVAMALDLSGATALDILAIFGRALESKTSEDIGTIEAVVGVK